MAKPLTKIDVKDCLSLDILNFVPLKDFPIYIRWGSEGVKNLCHIVDTIKNDFFAFEQVREKIKTKNFMRYFTLISNIPKEVKRCIRENLVTCNIENFNPEDIFLQKLLASRKNKYVYNNIIDKIVHLPATKLLKWEELLQCELVHWYKYFVILKKCCRDTYLFNFQYKFLHRIIPTNSFLFKIHIKDTKVCSFCKNEDETMEHLFFDCHVTFNFLQVFCDCLNLYYTNFTLTKPNFLLGFAEENVFINFLMIIAKNYIYKCKLNDKLPNIFDLKFCIKKYYSLELYIAKKQGNVEALQQRWSPITYIFPNLL